MLPFQTQLFECIFEFKEYKIFDNQVGTYL